MSDKPEAAEEVVEEVEKSVSIEDELGAIFDRANAEEAAPTRDEKGRFASKEADKEQSGDTVEAKPPAGAETVSADPSATPGAEPVKALDPPASWTAAAKANWPNLPRDIQAEVLRRETDWQKADGERTTKLKGYEPIEAALAPVSQQLQLNGVQPAQYVSQLVAADRYLRTNPQEAMRWIAQQYGIDLSQVTQQGPQVDPAFAPFVQEINALKGQISTFAQEQQRKEAAQTQAEIAAFAKDRPHFEEVRQQMGALIQSGAAADMSAAYDMAVWANPTTRAALQAKQSAEAEAKRKAEAEEKAGKARRVSQTNLSNKGTAGGATPPQYKSREDELGAIYDQVTGA